MADFQSMIAETVWDHQAVTWENGRVECLCSAGWMPDAAWAFHVARAVLDKLGLRQQFDSGSSVYNQRLRSVNVKRTRWVTDWVEEGNSYCNRCGIPHADGGCRREEK